MPDCALLHDGSVAVGALRPDVNLVRTRFIDSELPSDEIRSIILAELRGRWIVNLAIPVYG
jgi:hypothetical protein